MRKQKPVREIEERMINQLSKISRKLEMLAKQADTVLRAPSLSDLFWRRAMDLQTIKIAMLSKHLHRPKEEPDEELPKQEPERKLN